MREDWRHLFSIDDTPSESTKRRGSFKETAGKIIIFIIFLLINIIYAKNCDNILEWRKVHNEYLFFSLSLLLIGICSLILFTLLNIIVEKLEIYFWKYGLTLFVITITPPLLVIFAKDFRLSFLLFIFLFYLNAILIASFDVLDSYFYDFKNAVYLFTFLAITFLILGLLSKSGTIIFFWGLNLIAIQTSKKYLDENFRYKKLEKILDNIEDQSILAFIACKTNRWFIGCTALDRINDIKFLELISNEAILYEVQDIARYKLKLYVDFHLHQS